MIKFPSTGLDPDEQARRLIVEVERLSHQPDWLYWVEREDHAQQFGVKPATFKEMVKAQIKANEKKVNEAKAEQQRAEARAEKERERARKEQERKQEAERKAAEKAAEAQRKEREKGLVEIAKLPTAQHEARLVELAKRLGGTTPCFLNCLRDELDTILQAISAGAAVEKVEPWPEPVDTATLLNDVTAQLQRYVVIHDDAAMTAIVLWIAFAWLHDAIAVHSPLLVITGAGENIAKTLLCGVVQRLTPNAVAAAELTGPNLYRIVDQMHPTLITDDAHRLLERKPELAHIINVSWTRNNARIPRQERVNGQWVTHWFDVFCPKIIAGINVTMPKDSESRTIRVTMWPKLSHETVEKFRYEDNEEFQTLRRKFMRWATDNAARLKDARPKMPKGFDNRLKDNWELLLATAELAGSKWAVAARRAAKKLASEHRDPNENMSMLAAFHALFKQHGKDNDWMLSSAQVQEWLAADRDSQWADYHNRGRAITQREISILLDPYGIHPDVIHPKGKSARGYKVEWFETAWRHYLHRELSDLRPEPRKTKPRK
jgi:putative DNA primase/helicase